MTCPVAEWECWLSVLFEQFNDLYNPSADS